MTVYRVAGQHAYREHIPGAVFEATLDEDAEARAIRRGDIEILERSVTTIQPGSFRLPDGWAQRQLQTQEG